jgi:hypothetical protein
MVNSMLVNTAIILTMAPAILQFCATAFAVYANSTAVVDIFGVQVRGEGERVEHKRGSRGHARKRLVCGVGVGLCKQQGRYGDAGPFPSPFTRLSVSTPLPLLLLPLLLSPLPPSSTPCFLFPFL